MVWTSDSSIVSGLGDIGSYSTATVFLDGSTLKLISGEYNGGFYGWYWSGSTWIADSSIVSGLGVLGIFSIPVVFLDGSTLKLISGEYAGVFNGWYWSGSTWIADSSIVSGLGSIGQLNSSTVFLDGSTLKLISGELDGVFNGWYWSGSTWIADSSIVSGLSDVGVSSSPTVFLDGSTLKLISGSGESTEAFNGWYWSGSTWVADSSIISGLDGTTTRGILTVFLDGSALKLITGTKFGVFDGYTGPVISAAAAVNSGRPLRRSTGASVSGGIGCGMGKRRR